MTLEKDMLDIRKELVLDIKKELKIEGEKAQVYVAMDYSGSMFELYNLGKVQALVERLFPIALSFDDNGELDMIKFETRAVKLENPVTLKNYRNYVRDNISGNMGGTNYSPIIKEVMADITKEKKGLFGKFFGSSTPKQLDLPVYVIIITDGECSQSDERETEKELREASNHGVFFQFVGIGSSSFRFLEKLDNLTGRTIDNCNFFAVKQIEKMTDEELYKKLLSEFPTWVKQARTKNFIK